MNKVLEKPEIKSPEKLEQPVRLENWEHCLSCCGKPWPHFHGNCYNHPLISDGEYVRTSEIITVYNNIAVCKSRTWHLGKAK